jgi:hypothetical protein
MPSIVSRPSRKFLGKGVTNSFRYTKPGYISPHCYRLIFRLAIVLAFALVPGGVYEVVKKLPGSGEPEYRPRVAGARALVD